MKKGLIWMLFWEFFFVLFILPWAWLPMVLNLWDDEKPKFSNWVIKQATGRF